MDERPTIPYGRDEPRTRRRRLRKAAKWVGLGGGGVLLTLLLLHGAWLLYADRQLARRLAALRQAGEPTTLADLAPAAVPPSQNGFDDLARIGLWLCNSTRAAQQWGVLTDVRPPLTPFERDRLSRRIADALPCEPAMSLALARPQQANTTPPTSPMIQQTWPTLAGFRADAQFLADDALLAHDAGDDAKAFRRLTQVEPVARAADSVPTVIGTLVGLGVRATAIGRLSAIAPTLRIGDGPTDASRAAVRATIDGLLDDRATDATFLRAFRNDQAYQLDTTFGGTFLPPTGNAVADAVRGYLMKPLLVTAAADALDMTAVGKIALTDPDWPTAQRRLSVSNRTVGLINAIRPFMRFQFDSTQSLVQASFRFKAGRRLAAVALACRLFEIEHGRLPATLADLTPAYLPAVPLDPMAAGAPLRAVFVGQTARAWGVGDNGVDDGGSDVRPGSARSPLDTVVPLTDGPRVLPEITAVLIALDPDAPVEPSAATTRPSHPTSRPTASGVAPLPAVEEMNTLDVRGDAAALGLATRRDVLSALANSQADGVTLPASRPTAAVWGTAGTNAGVYAFVLTADGRGEVTGPDGAVTAVRWFRNGGVELPDYLR